MHLWSIRPWLLLLGIGVLAVVAFQLAPRRIPEYSTSEQLDSCMAIVKPRMRLEEVRKRCSGYSLDVKRRGIPGDITLSIYDGQRKLVVYFAGNKVKHISIYGSD